MLPAARSLTRKERRRMKELGIDPAFVDLVKEKLTVQELNDKIVEFMSSEVYHVDGSEYDDTPYSEFVTLADTTYRMTYALPIDAKNSSASGSGMLTDATNIATNA